MSRDGKIGLNKGGDNMPYRQIMIESFVKKQIENYIEEGWNIDVIDPVFRSNHIIDPLCRELNIDDNEYKLVYDLIERLLENG